MPTATETREHPILFKGHLVRAILEGRKTVTRRVAKPQHWKPRRPVTGPFWGSPGYPRAANGEWGIYLNRPGGGPYLHLGHCPYGQPGERLWVREAISKPHPLEEKAKNFTGFYRASDPDRKVKWTPSIHMPRWASRIDLEVTAVRVERINEITAQEVLKEGYDWKHNQHGERCQSRTVGQFAESWDAINGPRGFGWEANPWVWVIEFKRILP